MISKKLLNSFGKIKESFYEKNFNQYFSKTLIILINDIKGLRRHRRGEKCSGPESYPLPISFAKQGPSVPLGAPTLASPQTQGSGLRSTFGPTIGMVSQNYSYFWR